MSKPLALPGVNPGDKIPLKDWEILVSPGHVLRARLHDLIGRGFVRTQLLLLVFLWAAAFGIGSIYYMAFGGAAGGNATTPNWPSPLHRVGVGFTLNLFPALPSSVGQAAHKIDAAISAGGTDTSNLPPGMTADQLAGIMTGQQGGILAWINKTGLNADLATTAQTSGLPSSLTITRDEHFLEKLTPQNLAGGVIGIPDGALSKTNEPALLTGQQGYYGPFYVAGIVQGQIGIYVIDYATFGTACETIAGPAVGPCPAADQKYVDAQFSQQGSQPGPGVAYITTLAGLRE